VSPPSSGPALRWTSGGPGKPHGGSDLSDAPHSGVLGVPEELSGVQVLVNEDLAVVEDGRAGDARIVVRRQRLGAFFDSLDQRFGCNRESSMLKQSKRSRIRCSGTAAITG